MRLSRKYAPIDVTDAVVTLQIVASLRASGNRPKAAAIIPTKTLGATRAP